MASRERVNGVGNYFRQGGGLEKVLCYLDIWYWSIQGIYIKV